jgi:hypothetical protein
VILKQKSMSQPKYSFGQFIKQLSADDINRFMKALIREHGENSWDYLNRNLTINDWLTDSFSFTLTDENFG